MTNRPCIVSLLDYKAKSILDDRAFATSVKHLNYYNTEDSSGKRKIAFNGTDIPLEKCDDNNYYLNYTSLLNKYLI